MENWKTVFLTKLKRLWHLWTNFKLIQIFLLNRKMELVLNGDSCRFSYINARFSPGHSPCTYIVHNFLNGLPDVTSSQLDIYTNDISLYCGINTKSDGFDEVRWATDLKMTKNTLLNCTRRWLVNFNAWKTKTPSFTQLREHFLNFHEHGWW